MDLRELRNFRVVAEHGNFTRAAAQLHIAQSALSRQLRKLEHGFGVDLFLRTPRGVQLTAAGAILYEKTQRWENEIEALRREVSGIAEQVTGTLHIGVQHWVSTRLIPAIVKEYRERFPNVFLAIVDTYSGNITDGLLSQAIDIAVVETPTHEHRDLTASPLWSEHLCLFGPPDAAGSPLFQKAYASLHEIVELPLIMTSADHAIRRIINAAFGKSHLKLNPVIEANGPAMIFAMVKAGLGYSIMPRGGASSLLRRGEVVVLDIKPNIRRTISIVTRTDVLQERTVVPFIELVRSEAPQLLENANYGPVTFYSAPRPATGHGGGK